MVVFAHTSDGIVPWLKEFFHPDREDTLNQVCIVFEKDEIDRETSNYLIKPSIAIRASYIVGTALVKKNKKSKIFSSSFFVHFFLKKKKVQNDLVRAKVSQARHCFILAKKDVEEISSEDASKTSYITSFFFLPFSDSFFLTLQKLQWKSFQFVISTTRFQFQCSF